MTANMSTRDSPEYDGDIFAQKSLYFLNELSLVSITEFQVSNEGVEVLSAPPTAV